MIELAPQLALYPGVLIFLTVIACNFLGDGFKMRSTRARNGALSPGFNDEPVDTRR